MLLKGAFDNPADPTAPEMLPRKKYNLADYGTLKGSGLFQALTKGASADTARMGKNIGAADPGAADEYAQRQALGSIQPGDESQRQGQYKAYLGQQDNQDALMQAIFQQQQQAAAAQQAALGQLAGMGGGFMLGKKRNMFNTNKGLNTALTDPGAIGMGSVYKDYGVQ
jgi:hypothetical protein